MAEVNPPGYMQDGCYTAEQDRRLLGSIICEEGVAFGACPTGDLLVHDSTVGSMVVTVDAGTAFVKGDNTACDGMYHIVNDAPVDITLPASDPTDDRIVLVVAMVEDGQYGDPSSSWYLDVVIGALGTPAVAPAVPGNALVLAQVLINNGATNILPADITDRRVGYTLCNAQEPTQVVYTASSTFSKANYPGMLAARVHVIGGGGGGGGCSAPAAGQNSEAAGGGGGGYSVEVIAASALAASETVTVGAGGSPGVGPGTAGGTGGTSSFGTHLSASGGSGGTSAIATSGDVFSAGGNGGVGSNGTVNVRGGDGANGVVISGRRLASGHGGDAAGPYGGGLTRSPAGGGVGVTGNLYGGGGSGGSANAGGTANIGGVGAAGLVMIEVLY
jgi:hypothetical protein